MEVFLLTFFSLDTAYAKNKDDNRWYYFDDSSVSEAREESVCVSHFSVIFLRSLNASAIILPRFIDYLNLMKYLS